MIAWTPYAIFALIEQFGDPSLITPAMAILPALIAKSSICYNPLIYVGMNSQVITNSWNISLCSQQNCEITFFLLINSSFELHGNVFVAKNKQPLFAWLRQQQITFQCRVVKCPSNAPSWHLIKENAKKKNNYKRNSFATTTILTTMKMLNQLVKVFLSSIIVIIK